MNTYNQYNLNQLSWELTMSNIRIERAIKQLKDDLQHRQLIEVKKVYASVLDLNKRLGIE